MYNKKTLKMETTKVEVIRRRRGDRGIQQKFNYKVLDEITGTDKEFTTMKEISKEYGISLTGINQAIRGWRGKKYSHLTFQYYDKKTGEILDCLRKPRNI